MKPFLVSALALLSSTAIYADLPIDCSTDTYAYSKPVKTTCTSMLEAVDAVVQNDLKNFNDKVASGAAAIDAKTGSTSTASTSAAMGSTSSETATMAPAPVTVAPPPAAPAPPTTPSSGYKW